MKLNYKQELSRIKQIIRDSKSATHVFDSLEVLFTRISNKYDEKFQSFDFEKILNTPHLKKLTKAYKNNTAVIIEFKPLKTVNKQFVIVFMGYIKDFYTNIYRLDTTSVYIVKGE